MVFLKPPDPYPAAEYLPLAALLLPVLGSTIHGSAADWQRLLLLGFTLHHLIQFMRFPSGLIRASHAPSFPSASVVSSSLRPALVELRIINLFAISFLLASPFIALGFLRILQSALRPGDPLIDQFAIRLCVLAVALRPCAYLVKRLRPPPPDRSHRLSTAVEDLSLRSQNLSKTLDDHANLTATTSDLNRLSDETKAPISDLRRALNKLISRRQAAAPATLQAQHILAQTALNLALRTQTLLDSVIEQTVLEARRQASPSAILRARTNEMINATGTTLQIIGATLAPPPLPSPGHN